MDEADSVHVVEQEEEEVEEDDAANEDGAANEDVASLPDSARGDEPSIGSMGSVETVNDEPDDEVDAINNDPPLQPEVPIAPRQGNNSVPVAVRQLQGDLDGPHWNGGMVGSVIHEHCIGSVIREYNNLEAVSVSSTPQYSFQKGMKVFKDEGYKATVKELGKNLVGKNVIDMLPARSVTHDMMKMSLAYLMFLKRKRSLDVKARGCADRRPQREYITKLESSSLCVKTHALFLSCIVDAFKNRCVVITDIPAAFLSADWPEDYPDCHIRFEGVMVEMLCQIRPEYRALIKYSKNKNGQTRKVLVGRLTKTIYGTLLGAIEFYKKLRGVLTDLGF